MDNKDKLTIAFCGACFAGGIALLAYAVLGATRRTGTLRPGEVPLTAVDLPSQSNDPVVAGASPCRAILRWDFHLRPAMQESRAGSVEYRAGTEAVILRAGTLPRRNGALLYQVRIVRTGAVGWIYVLPTEIVGDCTGASDAEIARRLSARDGAAPTATPGVLAGIAAAAADAPPIRATT